MLGSRMNWQLGSLEIISDVAQLYSVRATLASNVALAPTLCFTGMLYNCTH